ncbi:hypothetical protein [Mycolicibacter hiberniae]|uniref:Uncharacterized protein n=1 Tax=Mycolicibacter hiberniae TaxID=29314 RepID=A0A7I7X264_9MYCO|nr:hypothetical protein [Mycolicibacter hiberniae]MCV7084885.1 hypothetical protein [Mycolicibacter hiberniae]ORV71511.1 hypothetical protein AWC09_06455 [Mycolicibacter hiberniae]BBZ23275.1 hypothetical protein MHIB_16930 [Mycolicibacter hiberniae]
MHNVAAIVAIVSFSGPGLLLVGGASVVMLMELRQRRRAASRRGVAPEKTDRTGDFDALPDHRDTPRAAE